MDDRELGRREFLKATLASAAAAGLSHFQILNFGKGTAFAAECEPGEDPDKCDASSQDLCLPEDPDFCPDPSGAEDVCTPDPFASGCDVCDPLGIVGEPDVCLPGQDPDACLEPPGADGDICEPVLGDPDLQSDDCTVQGVDICEPGNLNPDTCEPAIAIPDTCLGPGDDLCPEGQGMGDGDICEPAMGEPDKCLPLDPYLDPDECMPVEGDPDECLPQVQDVDVPPTAVAMASFNAGWTREGVRVEWETASELDSLGFNLYRSPAARSGYQQINASLIPCQSPGTAQGAAYSYLDSQAQAGTVYYYVIETLDAQGRADRYGPVVANTLRRLLPTRRRPAAGGASLESQ